MDIDFYLLHITFIKQIMLNLYKNYSIILNTKINETLRKKINYYANKNY